MTRQQKKLLTCAFHLSQTSPSMSVRSSRLTDLRLSRLTDLKLSLPTLSLLTVDNESVDPYLNPFSDPCSVILGVVFPTKAEDITPRLKNRDIQIRSVELTIVHTNMYGSGPCFWMSHCLLFSIFTFFLKHSFALSILDTSSGVHLHKRTTLAHLSSCVHCSHHGIAVIEGPNNQILFTNKQDLRQTQPICKLRSPICACVFTIFLQTDASTLKRNFRQFDSVSLIRWQHFSTHVYKYHKCQYTIDNVACKCVKVVIRQRLTTCGSRSPERALAWAIASSPFGPPRPLAVFSGFLVSLSQHTSPQFELPVYFQHTCLITRTPQQGLLGRQNSGFVWRTVLTWATEQVRVFWLTAGGERTCAAVAPPASSSFSLSSSSSLFSCCRAFSICNIRRRNSTDKTRVKFSLDKIPQQFSNSLCL